MSTKPIVSVLNLKNGVGCSAITWNIAHTLCLDIYEHDKAMHHFFLEKRKVSVEYGELHSNEINVYPINKRKLEHGIYDLGSDINYAYVRQILAKSDVIVIPTDVSYEVTLKTIGTIKYARQQNVNSKIIVLFNRLDNSDTERDKNYTKEAKLLIEQHMGNDENLEFLYLRFSFAIFKNLAKGFYYLDNFVHQERKFKPITQFNLLRNLRWYSINKMLNSKRASQAQKEMERTDFFDKYKEIYLNYTYNVNISKIYNLKYNNKNRKLIKDMLILTTRIKGEYARLWEDKNA